MALDFEPPGPGTWLLDKSHIPAPPSHLIGSVVTRPFAEGFTETVTRYGTMLQDVRPAIIGRWLYLRIQAVGEPGPDGPPAPDAVGAEIGRRATAAAEAFETRLWRVDLERWDKVDKPVSIERHKALWTIDRGALSDEELAEHLAEVATHHADMVRQHHRYNSAAMVPVGDFLVQAATWTGRPPDALFGLFAGASPVSGIRDSEIAPAADAIASDPEARAVLEDEGDPAKRLAVLRAQVPAVAEWLGRIEYRLVDGFDPILPTLVEVPELILGRLRGAISFEQNDAPAAALEQTVRAAVPEEHRAAFDDLLAEARAVYRLRDERGIYSDISSAGILRYAVLEAGKRLLERGAIGDVDHAFEALTDELGALLTGRGGPSPDVLAARNAERLAAAEVDPPPFIGPPPAEPPPLDMLPPPVARVTAAFGFAVDAILRGLTEPVGDATTIGGLRGSAGVYEGSVRLVVDPMELLDLEEGEVLLAPTTSEAFNCAIHLPGAIVTDYGGVASHAAIVAREIGIPAVVGTLVATQRLRTGMRVVVDGDAGEVRIIG